MTKCTKLMQYLYLNFEARDSETLGYFRRLVITQMLQDYYAALTYLYLDFEAGLTDNLAYFRKLEKAFCLLVIDNHDVDDLDMAWEKAEKWGDFSAFDTVVERLVRNVK